MHGPSQLPLRIAGTVTAKRQQTALAIIERPLPALGEQLQLFSRFTDDVSGDQCAIIELFDALPLFHVGAVTTYTQRCSTLPVIRRETTYAGCNLRVTIKPVIIEPRATSRRRTSDRKEVIPGEREQTLYRVLRKMASDASCQKATLPSNSGVQSVVIRCSVRELRKRLAEVHRGLTAWEVREALRVLGEATLQIENLTTGRSMYAGTYITFREFATCTDSTGERTFCYIALNELATKALMNGLYDTIDYRRLMGLRSGLAQWMYETVVRQFRQASPGIPFSMTLSRILRDGPLRPYRELRKALETVDDAFAELRNSAIIAFYPPFRRLVDYRPSGRSGGRPAIRDVTFSFCLAEDASREILRDNVSRERRGSAFAAPLHGGRIASESLVRPGRAAGGTVCGSEESAAIE